MHANTMLIAKRYATALYECLETSQKRESVLGQVEKMLAVFSEELDQILAREAVSGEVKKALALELARAVQADELVVRTMELMGDRKRLGVLRSFLMDLRARLDQSLGVERVDYISATEISDVEKASISQQLSKALGGSIRLRTEHAPDLLAGCIVRVGHRVADLSLRSRLIQMREVLSQGV